MKISTPLLKFLLFLLVLLPPSYGDQQPWLDEDDLHNSDDFLQADQPPSILTFHDPYVEVTLQLGSGLKASSIKEGDDIHFECLITARREDYPFSLSNRDIWWVKNGVYIKEVRSDGVLVSGNNLVLQRVHRSFAGDYRCEVGDVNGLSAIVSNTVTIGIEYSPVCSNETHTIFVKEGDRFNLKCNADPDARPNMRYTWYLNNTNDVREINYNENNLHVESMTDNDYGIYSCWETSDIGTQDVPCVNVKKANSPVCSNETQTVFVKEGDSMNLKCNVDARPNTDMRYTWYLNNTNDVREIYSNEGNINVETMTDNDYGMYNCWATNDIGTQDTPCIFNVKKPNIAFEVERFLELVGTGNSLCNQYGSLATKAKQNSIKVNELTNISQRVMRLLWKNWLDTVMWKDSVFGKIGLLHKTSVNTSVVRPHPLYELNTNLTSSDQFTIEILMKMKRRANIGLRLMWVPQDGAPYSWDDDDILYSAHFRWVYPNRDWGKEKQVVFNSKQNGMWADNQTVFDEWPKFQIGQKFKLQITTHDTDTNKCFNMRLYMGHERFHIIPSKPPIEYVFCLPLTNWHVQKSLSDPRHLKLVLNEDIMFDLEDAYDIYQVLYMPKVLQFSPGQIEEGL